MQIKLSRAEYWILETLVRFKYPLSDYASPDHELIFNQPSHGLNRADLLDTLEAMVRARWIETHWWDDSIVEDSESGAFFPERDEIDKAMDGRRVIEMDWASRQSPLLYAQLTPLGGSIWESFACPKWERFIDDCIQTEVGELSSIEKGNLEYYLLHAHYLGIIVKAETLKWEIVSPWEATYWKTFPQAHRVRFERHQEELSDSDEQRSIPHSFMTSLEWYRWS